MEVERDRKQCQHQVGTSMLQCYYLDFLFLRFAMFEESMFLRMITINKIHVSVEGAGVPGSRNTDCGLENTI